MEARLEASGSSAGDVTADGSGGKGPADARRANLDAQIAEYSQRERMRPGSEENVLIRLFSCIGSACSWIVETVNCIWQAVWGCLNALAPKREEGAAPVTREERGIPAEWVGAYQPRERSREQ